jgi:hypothetical protein
VIKLNKEEAFQKVFLSLGTFIDDDNGNLLFKVFLRRQIISYTSNNIYLKLRE